MDAKLTAWSRFEKVDPEAWLKTGLKAWMATTMLHGFSTVMFTQVIHALPRQGRWVS